MQVFLSSKKVKAGGCINIQRLLRASQPSGPRKGSWESQGRPSPSINLSLGCVPWDSRPSRAALFLGLGAGDGPGRVLWGLPERLNRAACVSVKMRAHCSLCNAWSLSPGAPPRTEQEARSPEFPPYTLMMLPSCPSRKFHLQMQRWHFHFSISFTKCKFLSWLFYIHTM